MKKKIWVVGADGLVGSQLRGHAAVASGRSDADIGDIDSLRAFAKRFPGITHVVNCAALSNVDYAEAHREEALRANTIGPENLAFVADSLGARFLHISTDYVFKGEGSVPLRENHPMAPVNYYGQTKMEGEFRVSKVFPESCILRTSWVFGNGGKNFVAGLLKKLLAPEEILLTNDHFGRPTYVEDLVSVILEMLDASGVYHFANAGAASKYEFGVFMEQEARRLGFAVQAARIIPVSGSVFTQSAPRPKYSVFDTSKIETFLKRPIRSWQTCLREHLCSVKSRES